MSETNTPEPTEQDTKNIPAVVIESTENGNLVPLEQFRSKIAERVEYSIENAPVQKGPLHEAAVRTVHKFFANRFYKVATDRWAAYEKDNKEDIESLLDTEISMSEKVAFNLPENFVAVKNPQEYLILLKECERVATNSNKKTLDKDLEHELNHWLPMMENADAHMLFGVLFEKKKDGTAEWAPFVLPYGTFSVRAYISCMVGPEKLNDLSVNDKNTVALLLDAVREAEGDEEKLADNLNKIFTGNA